MASEGKGIASGSGAAAAPVPVPVSGAAAPSKHARTRSGTTGELRLTPAVARLSSSEGGGGGGGATAPPPSPRTPGGRSSSRGGEFDTTPVTRSRGLSGAGAAGAPAPPFFGRLERSASLPLITTTATFDELHQAISVLSSLLTANTGTGSISKDELDSKLSHTIKLIKKADETAAKKKDYEALISDGFLRRRSSLHDLGEIEVVDWLQADYMGHRRGSGASSGSGGIGTIAEEGSWDGHSAKDLMEELDTKPRRGRARGTSRAMQRTTELKDMKQDPVRELGIQLVSSAVAGALLNVNLWEWDVFGLEAVAEGRPLSLLVYHLLETLDVFDKFKLSRTNFVGFITAIEEGYMNNPYHNAIHAADVVQNIYFFLRSASLSGLINTADVFAGLLSAAIHDYAHPGTNNGFQIATDSELALRYNDRAVLENMHLSESFAIMRQEGCNPFHGLPPEIKKQLRGTMISMVLATDMSHHFALIGDLNKAFEGKKAQGIWFDHKKDSDRLLCVQAAMHCADLGNPLKPRDTYLRWVGSINEEFWQQGDEEKKRGLVISPMCDRSKPNIELSQTYFMDHIVRPLYQVFSTICPEVKQCLDLMDANRAYFEEKIKAGAQVPVPPRITLTATPSATPVTLVGPTTTTTTATASSSSSSSSSAATPPVAVAAKP